MNLNIYLSDNSLFKIVTGCVDFREDSKKGKKLYKNSIRKHF
jgi:ribosomal protein L27